VPKYRPVDAMKAPRFTGIASFMRLPQVSEMDGVDAAIVGIPFDTSVSYRIGGRFGPAAIPRGATPAPRSANRGR